MDGGRDKTVAARQPSIGQSRIGSTELGANPLYSAGQRMQRQGQDLAGLRATGKIGLSHHELRSSDRLDAR